MQVQDLVPPKTRGLVNTIPMADDAGYIMQRLPTMSMNGCTISKVAAAVHPRSLASRSENDYFENTDVPACGRDQRH